MFTFFFVGLKVVAVIVFFFYFSSYLINRILLVSCGESFITLVCRDFRSSPKEQSFFQSFGGKFRTNFAEFSYFED